MAWNKSDGSYHAVYKIPYSLNDWLAICKCGEGLASNFIPNLILKILKKILNNVTLKICLHKRRNGWTVLF